MAHNKIARIILILPGSLLILVALFVGINQFSINQKIGITPWICFPLGLFILGLPLIQTSWFVKFSQTLSNHFSELDRLFFSLYRSRWGLMLIFMIPCTLFFYPSISSDYPIGYSGLYALMATRLQQNHFIPPINVPYYSSGSVPFAYPPFGLYMAGIALSFGIQIFDYLKIISPLLGLLCLVVFYKFVLELTNRRSKAILSILLICTSYEFFEKQINAAGMVRGWALLFCLLALFLFLKSLRGNESNKFNLPLSSLLLGLTALSHFSYFLFALLFSGLLYLFNAPGSNFKRYLIFLLGGISVSCIWYIPAMARIGLEGYWGALNSHNNLSILNFIKHPDTLLTSLFYISKNWMGTSLIGLSILGLLYNHWKRNWVLVLCTVISYLFIGEGERFVILLASILVADLCIDMMDAIKLSGTKSLSFGLKSFSMIILIINLFVFNYPAYWNQSNLNSSVMEMTNWFKRNSPINSTYILLSDNHNLSEWMPYLTNRTTLVGHWGSEWNNRYDKDIGIFKQIGKCSVQESLDCLNKILEGEKLNPTNLISLSSHTNLNNQLLQSQKWKSVFENGQFIIYK